jgi:hypothetical protein
MSPTVIARRFLTALAKARWAEAAALIHPESRRNARTSTVSHLVAWAQFRAAESSHDAHQTSGYGSTGSIDPAALEMFGHVVVPTYRDQPTIAQLAALSPLHLTERLLDAANARDLPSGAILHRFPAPVVLGHVMDGPRWAQVVIRDGSPTVKGRRHDVTTLPLHRAGSAWRVRLSHDFAHVHFPMTDDDPFMAMARELGISAG